MGQISVRKAKILNHFDDVRFLLVREPRCEAEHIIYLVHSRYFLEIMYFTEFWKVDISTTQVPNNIMK